MADGDVYGYGDAPWDVAGGQVPTALAAPVVGVAMSADDAGYWLAGADGRVRRGQAPFLGSLGASGSPRPSPGSPPTPIATATGSWVRTAGCTPSAVQRSSDPPRLGVRPDARIVGIATTSDGKGYWLVDADGGVFALGDATYLGGPRTRLAAPVVGIAATTSDPLPRAPRPTSPPPPTRTATWRVSPSPYAHLLQPDRGGLLGRVGSRAPGCSDAFVYQSSGPPFVGPEVLDAQATPQGRGRPVPPATMKSRYLRTRS